LLRALVSRYLDLEPSSVEFGVDQHGKPALARTMRRARLSFNLSHSGPLALYAFAEAMAVGVDVQTAPTRAVNEPAIAGRAFGEDEARRLADLDPAEREAAFLRAWVRHEATVKCRGVGLGRDLQTISPDAGKYHEPSPAAPKAGDRYEPWVADLDLGAAVAGALAVSRPPRKVLCWSWQAPA
jgi:4'-phosphopantetheinyl transferase